MAAIEEHADIDPARDVGMAHLPAACIVPDAAIFPGTVDLTTVDALIIAPCRQGKTISCATLRRRWPETAIRPPH